MKHLIITLVLFILPLYSNEKTNQLDITTGFDVLGNSIKYVLTNYIDDIEVDTIIKASIEGMLSSLDPYSEYYNQSNSNDIISITNGKYYGFGFLYKFIHNNAVLTNIRDNSPAKYNDLKVGDIIYSINDIALDTNNSDIFFSNLNDNCHFVIIRKGINTADTLHIYLDKDIIQVDAITYSSILNNNVGYIKIEQFTINSYKEFMTAFYDMQKRKVLSGLIIDLRGNSGGIMQEALKICNMFVPRGSILLTTKGKNHDREYKAISTPVDTLLPIIVLIDEGSASASEIVAGCLQDLDRAIVIGNTSFGKGLVQEVFPLFGNHYIKLTTAKYYTPSGRSIQKINYSNNKTDTINKIDINDNFKIFRTKQGKELYESNGIKPDILVSMDTLENQLCKMLIENFIIYNFVTEYINTFGMIDINEHIDTLYEKFVIYATNYSNAKYMTTIAEMDLIRNIDTSENIVNIINNTIDIVLLEYKKMLLSDEYIKKTIKKYMEYDYRIKTMGFNNFMKHIILDDKVIKMAIDNIIK